MPGILIVDENRGQRHILRRIFESAGLPVAGEAGSGGETLTFLMKKKPLMVTLDLILPDMNGIDLLRIIRMADPAIPVIICTGFWHDDIRDMVLGEGASAAIQKPVHSGKLLESTAELLQYGEFSPLIPQASCGIPGSTDHQDFF